MKKKLLVCSLIIAFMLILSVAAVAKESFAPGSAAVYFVNNTNGKDTNVGTSASSPLKTLGKALGYLREAHGGTVVISGEVKISAAYSPADVGGSVVFTSVWNGVDYRESGAKMVVAHSMAFNNDTYFENMNFVITGSGLVFSGRCHNFGFGEDITVTKNSTAESFVYPTIIGGWNNPSSLADSSNANDYTVYVYSGTWSSVSAGHKRSSASNALSALEGDVSLIIGGGTFTDNVYGTGMNVHTNRFYMGISGGNFKSAVAPIKRLGTIDTTERTDKEFTADVLVEISSGTFDGRFRLAESTVETTGVTYVPKGDATVVVTGGTFNSDFTGYGVIGSVLLKYKEDVLAADKIKGFQAWKTGTQSMSTSPTEQARFTNPIGDKADPYIIEKDGIYYYCFASSVTIDGTSYAAIKIAAHGSIGFGNLTTQNRAVFNSSRTTIENAKREYWAPELHYFDAKTVGSENAGWYIYFAADNGENANHRMYVLRATEPENPLSDFEMVGQITDSTNKWAIDGTVLQQGGKLYFVWSGWEGNTNVAQNIYIAEMSNPWTISSSRVLLSAPTYSWETQGNPDVNEGPQILQHNGSTHIVYSASGSWSQYYCYGVLTLTGTNPLNASHWYKATSAKFASGNGIYGPGHGTFVRDSVGEWWMIYHANNTLTVPSGSTWWAQRDTYAKQFTFTTTTLNGVSVTYPSFGTPAASGGTQYIYVRTADYHASGDHLYSAVTKVTNGDKTSLVKRCFICGEETTLASVGTPKVLAAVNESTGKIALTITPSVSGASGYIIYRSENQDGEYAEIAKISGTTYTDNNANIGTTYYYKAVQYKSNVYGSDETYGRLESSASAATSGRTAVPAAVEFTIYFDGEIVKLDWTASESATKFRIFKRVKGESEWGSVMTAESSYTDNAVVAGTTYEYCVQEWALVGGTHYYSHIAPTLTTITTTVISAPTLTVANTENGIKLTASEVSGATGYKFYRSTDGVTYTQIAKTESTSYTDTTAVSGIVYYYRARAYSQSENVVNYGTYSNALTAVDFAFSEATSGSLYESVMARANGNEFVLLKSITDTKKTSALPFELGSLPSGKYVYAIYGEYILPNAVISENASGYYTATLPYENASGLIFANEPIILYGDADLSGDIVLLDIIKILRYASGDETGIIDLASANICHDLELDTADVLYALKELLK